MKKAYEKPRIEVTEFHFSEHIAVSGGLPSQDECTRTRYYDINKNLTTSGCVVWTGID